MRDLLSCPSSGRGGWPEERFFRVTGLDHGAGQGRALNFEGARVPFPGKWGFSKSVVWFYFIFILFFWT